MARFLIYQSLWAMERRHTDGHKRTLAEILEMIRGAGFDGVSVTFEVRELARQVTDFLKPHGMSE